MRDPILAGLVAATRASTDLRIPVTVITGGVIADGLLVAEAHWLDRVAEVLEAGGPGAAVFGGGFREVKVAVEMMTAVNDPAAELLHLVDARLLAAGEVVSVGLWRIGLDAVDGWKLGMSRPQPLRAVEG